jgi:hypothetical protein
MVIAYQIMSYSNTSVFKTTLTSCASTASGNMWVGRMVGLWRSTSAINTVTALLSASNYRSGTVFSLYGIKAA